jgi:hypothetical protein
VSKSCKKYTNINGPSTKKKIFSILVKEIMKKINSMGESLHDSEKGHSFAFGF